MIFKRYNRLEKALDIFYKSRFRDIEIDRYSLSLDKKSILLFQKPWDDPGPIEQYVYYAIGDDGTIEAVNPMLMRFNPLLIKKIPGWLLSKYKQSKY